MSYVENFGRRKMRCQQQSHMRAMNVLSSHTGRKMKRCQRVPGSHNHA